MNRLLILGNMIAHVLDEQSKEDWTRVKDVVEGAQEWREAKCSNPSPKKHMDPQMAAEYCDGDNHLENCPVELARQDLIACLNKLEGP